MSDIDPNAAEKLIQASAKLMNKQGNKFPAMRKVLAGLRELGEPTEEQEAALDEVEKVYNSTQALLKKFPPPKS